MIEEQVVVESRIAELEAIEDEQDRIDRVAEDLKSGANRYAVIDAWELGDLLGVSPDDAGGGDWSHIQYVYALDFDDICDPYKRADQLHLLEGEVDDERYEELVKLAEAIEETGEGPDLPLTEDELETLKNEYAKANVSDSGPTLATITVRSTGGVPLEFNATLSDGYPDGGAWSPYDLANGRGFDPRGYITLDR